MKLRQFVFGLVCFFVVSNVFAGEKCKGLKKALEKLNAEKVEEGATYISGKTLKNIVLAKKEFGELLNVVVQNKTDAQIGEMFSKTICGLDLKYVNDAKNSVTRTGKNYDGYFDEIAWDIYRFPTKSAEYLFITVMVSMGYPCDTFIYSFKKTNMGWERIFENDNPDYSDALNGRCGYKICKIEGNISTYFLIVNTYPPPTSNIGRVAYSVFVDDLRGRKLRMLKGPYISKAIIPDPGKPFFVTGNKTSAVLKFICDRDALAKDQWFEAEFSEKNGTLLEDKRKYTTRD